MIIAIIITIVVAIMLIVLACCKASGDCSRAEQEREKKENCNHAYKDTEKD